MKTFKLADAAQTLGESWREGRTIGFVPTMGALHEGHLSLVRRARQDNDVVVVSIFVNPLQFGAGEDLDTYPRDLEGDSALLEREGVDFLFAPEAAEMYPSGRLETRVIPGRIGELLEGAFRPGFFTGVATVCMKLFSIIKPRRAYFGQKDAQQLAVIRRVVADLNLPIEVVGCPTVRDKDGLAASSRNAYLDAESREAASVIGIALGEAAQAFQEGTVASGELCRMVKTVVRNEPSVRVQYAEVVNPQTFESVITADQSSVMAIAVNIGKTRLIDNVVLGEKVPVNIPVRQSESAQ